MYDRDIKRLLIMNTVNRLNRYEGEINFVPGELKVANRIYNKILFSDGPTTPFPEMRLNIDANTKIARLINRKPWGKYENGTFYDGVEESEKDESISELYETIKEGGLIYISGDDNVIMLNMDLFNQYILPLVKQHILENIDDIYFSDAIIDFVDEDED